jgi:putative ABC transport system permease protein
MVGAPQTVVAGSLEDLRRPDAVMMDSAGCKQLWPDDPLRLGRVFEMNDRRAVLVGVCEASRTFQTFPVVYTRYTQAERFVPQERKVMSFVLVKARPGVSPVELCRRITEQTELKAVTRQEFIDMTFRYFMRETGIPINFGITVILGFVVGTAVAGQTFYLFTLENLTQFGALKAMGATNLRIVGMVLLQALLVGTIGYAIGVGLAAGFGLVATNNTKLAFRMEWWILAGTLASVVLIIVLSSVLSIRRVLVVEPAIVFRA